MDDFSSDDDLLQLVDDEQPKPQDKVRQGSGVKAEPVGNGRSLTQPNPVSTDNVQGELMRAQGETSMLRDKIKLLQSQIDQEKNKSNQKADEIRRDFQHEIESLRLSLQGLEDEKKFLIMETRGASSVQRSRPSLVSSSRMTSQPAMNTPDNSNSNIEPYVKKQKTEKSRPSISLNPNRISPDEVASFFDNLFGHRIVGVDMTTLEILSCIKFDHLDGFTYKLLTIPKGESIGNRIIQFFLGCKKSMKLDDFIDTVLEHFAFLMKAVLVHEQESNLAIPFLVALMVQAVLFRPSAVSPNSLKELFLFTCDLIRKYQKVLKQPLHKNPLELNLGPEVFQYELLDNMCLFYAFDLLEATSHVLRTQNLPANLYLDFFAESIIKALENVYRLALTISFKPIINVIFNMVEILLAVSSIMVKNSLPKPIGTVKWWSDLLTRLYHILKKDIFNMQVFSDDESPHIYLDKYHDMYSLLRNMGTNHVGIIISQLVTKDSLQGLPNVITKDYIEDDYIERQKEGLTFYHLDLEKWFLNLKDDVLSIIENLLSFFSSDISIVNGDMLMNLTKMISSEQSYLIESLIDQENDNVKRRVTLIEHSLSLIYRIWRFHEKNISQEYLKDIENDLVMCLWRVIVCKDARDKVSIKDIREHRYMIDQLEDLHLKDDIDLFDDALEDMPDYIATEIDDKAGKKVLAKMQVYYDDIYIEMARYILESKLTDLISVENADSLYLAMGL
ncbi:DNA damage checkpoint protein LCD1 [Nakaseomyces bracarensis]|uniref:DNA damage checkpoint protein LCD1 n=1 Tax=Nakaseomyces bracarensis TaxID=273131 RepID=A0ABR4NQD5_9SACH